MRVKFVSLLFLAAIVGWAVALLLSGKGRSVHLPLATAAHSTTLQVDSTPLTHEAAEVRVSYADMVETVQPAVVSVYSTKIVTTRMSADPWSRFFGGDIHPREQREEGLGSGVIVSSDGYIITNNHVVEGADELSVLMPDDREYRATLIGADPKTDVAVIKIEAADLPTVTLADSDKLRVGDVVFAFGNPLGVGQTVTMGIVSAKGRNSLGLLETVAGYEDFIQTDAAINMGNSGGALVDAKGRLVGINSAIVSTTKGNIGIGFAIPINLAASIMHSLVETGTVARGYLGAAAETVSAEVLTRLGMPEGARGVVLTQVTPEGPAEEAGLRPTDVVYSINGRSISTLEDLRLQIAQSAPGSAVEIAFLREGQQMTATVTLGQVVDRPNELLEGVDVEPLSTEVRRRLGIDPRVAGLVITGVAEDSPYAGYLIPEVVIVEINRSPVATVAAAKGLLREGRNLLLINYRGQYHYLSLTVD
ncbi:protease Do [Cephaloticoccus primus]|uniref:Protease Do n=1 Tax=Cephaloticoccus primus TaxID=1548207 RepID=A0A139SKH7_9BACT|nr:Do family serine endopeptidase [Cephaloticoccus primus]KXU34994.1 protease Do [Cephaloticoccus primus]